MYKQISYVWLCGATEPVLIGIENRKAGLSEPIDMADFVLRVQVFF
jgi:hypothetical protein